MCTCVVERERQKQKEELIRQQGAIQTDKILNIDMTSDFTAPLPLVKMSFSPLAHSERVSVILCLAKGGRIGVYGGVRCV